MASLARADTAAARLAGVTMARLGRYRRPFDAEREADWIAESADLASVDVVLSGAKGWPSLEANYAAVAAALSRRAGRTLEHQTYKQLCESFTRLRPSALPSRWNWPAGAAAACCSTRCPRAAPRRPVASNHDQASAHDSHRGFAGGGGGGAGQSDHARRRCGGVVGGHRAGGGDPAMAAVRAVCLPWPGFAAARGADLRRRAGCGLDSGAAGVPAPGRGEGGVFLCRRKGGGASGIGGADRGRGPFAGQSFLRAQPRDQFFSAARLRADLERTQAVIQQAAGTAPLWFRPPVGLSNPRVFRVARDLGLTVVGWSARGLDTQTTEPERIVARIERRLAPGAIILLHDGNIPAERLVQTVKMLLDRLRALGYEVARLDEMLT